MDCTKTRKSKPHYLFPYDVYPTMYSVPRRASRLTLLDKIRINATASEYQVERLTPTTITSVLRCHTIFVHIRMSLQIIYSNQHPARRMKVRNIIWMHILSYLICQYLVVLETLVHAPYSLHETNMRTVASILFLERPQINAKNVFRQVAHNIKTTSFVSIITCFGNCNSCRFTTILFFFKMTNFPFSLSLRFGLVYIS